MRAQSLNRLSRWFLAGLIFLLVGIPTAQADSPEELFNKAMSLDRDGFFEEEAEVWEKLLAANPEKNLRNIAQLKLASTRFKLLQFKKSEELSRDLTVSEPDNFDAHFHLANILTAQQRFPEAINSFRKTIEIRPGEGLGYVGLALSYFGNREPDKAIVEVNTAKKIFRKKKNIVWTQNMRYMAGQIKNFNKYPPSFSNLWLENNIKLVRETYEETLFEPAITP